MTPTTPVEAAESAASLPDMHPQPKEADMAEENSPARADLSSAEPITWPWWWSKDQERYSGPCSTRVEAICSALSEDHLGSIHVMQATHGELNYAVFDGSEIADAFDNANEEAADGEDDPLSAQVPGATWAAIAKSVEAQVKKAVYAKGVTAWGFAETTGGEWVELSNPHLAALPAEVRQLLVEAAMGFENNWSPHYIDELIARLKATSADRAAIAQATGEGR